MRTAARAVWIAFAFCSVLTTITRAAETTGEAATLFRLECDEAKGALVDRTGRFVLSVTGGSIMQDEQRGPCIRLGDGDSNCIVIKDDGKISFEGGITIDLSLYFEEEPAAKPAPLAIKVGSFDWDLGKGKLNTAWLVFPSEEIFTDKPGQFKYFPVGGDTVNGLMHVPVKKWTRLNMAYDELLGAITTRINGMPDRSRYRYRGPERMQCDGRSAFTFLQGFKNVRVSSIEVRTGRPRLAEPSMEVYVNPLPYQDRVLLTFDHIDPALPLPIEATIIWEKASGEAATVTTVSLDSHAKKDVSLDLPTWKNSLHTIIVNANAGGRGVYSKNFRIANVKPEGPVTIGADHSVSKDGKKFFPLMVYHAMPDDFPQLAEMGFNLLLNDFNIRQPAGKDQVIYNRLLTESFDAAQKNGLLMLAVANSDYNKLPSIAVGKGHPALFGWYGADEPWGDLSRLVESYNTIKMLEPDMPVVIIQNNYSRLQETSMGADIVGVDPYPVPNVSMRGVFDATQAAVRATSGCKPIWTIIPQYETKVPTREELRVMAWLAIAGGANGVGFFDWDERRLNVQTGEWKGWYTKERPEQVEKLRVVLKELKSQEALLMMPPALKQPSLSPANLAVHVLVKEADGKCYVIIANDSRRAEEATLQFEDVPDGDFRSVLGGDASLRVQGGKATISMPPFGAKAYDVSR